MKTPAVAAWTQSLEDLYISVQERIQNSSNVFLQVIDFDFWMILVKRNNDIEFFYSYFRKHSFTLLSKQLSLIASILILLLLVRSIFLLFSSL